MWYLFHQYNSQAGEVELAGMVHIQATPEDNSTNGVFIQEIIPEDFKDYLTKSVYGHEFMALDRLGTGEKGFDPLLMTHWHALPVIFNISGGYGGVEEYTDEEFLALAKELGFEEEEMQSAAD